MSNLIIQTIGNFPAFVLTLTILILAGSVKSFRETGFFIVGCVVTLLSIITTLIFWSTEPSATELASFIKIVNVVFAANIALIDFGVIQVLLEKNSIYGKQNVFLLLLLSVVTLGMYVPVWYLKQYIKFSISNRLIIVFLFVMMPAFIMHWYRFSGEPFSELASILTDIVVGVIAILLAFNLRSHMLQKNDDLEIDPILTFFLGIFYLQYKLNQTEVKSETV